MNSGIVHSPHVQYLIVVNCAVNHFCSQDSKTQDKDADEFVDMGHDVHDVIHSASVCERSPERWEFIQTQKCHTIQISPNMFMIWISLRGNRGVLEKDISF